MSVIGGRGLARLLGGAALTMSVTTGALWAQERPPACPRSTGRLLEEGWRLLRADSAGPSAARFSAALSECPASADAMVGLGFAALRRGQSAQAESLFVDVTRRVPSYVDAWDGLATARFRQSQLDGARFAWSRAIELQPTHPGARAGLARLDPDWERRRRPLAKRRAPSLDVTMRVWEERFEMRRRGRWQPFYVKGVNLGLALPGRWASEPPTDSATYAGWLQQIGTMNANTVRVYTILPPAFYRALRGHNLTHPTRPVFLMHGVWTELPPNHDFSDSTFSAGFAAEIRDVVDLLHGAADIAPRPGHAGGWYDADVSPWTIGYIVGREWEPYSVVDYDRNPAAPRRFEGRHLTIAQGTPTDVWMVRQCDLLLSYEESTYNAQRPIAYSNWPTTDPMRHATELTFAEELRARGITPTAQQLATQVYDDEAVSLTPTAVRRTARNLAGWFASYHVYPYFPDFMLYDPDYSRARSSLGPSNYFGYLQDLKRAHAGIPLLISEFGVPSSRGNAHLQPQGWHHGGLNETQQAEIVVRLEKEIRESGAAGAIVFSWMDEWFKPNWLVADFMRPAERAPKWHNMMSPEQHYGIVAVRPGSAQGPTLGGDPAPWRRLPVVMGSASDSTRLRLGADPGFLYLAVEATAWRGATFDWRTQRIQIALDTHRGDAGEFLLPTSGLEANIGFEFLLEFDGPDEAQLRVTPEYNLYTPARLVQSGPQQGVPFRRPVRSVARRDATFDTLYTMTNRPRLRRDGSVIRGTGLNQGRLRLGRSEENSLADWWMDTAVGMLQVRIPWGLLNVGDPSSRQVLTDAAVQGPLPETRPTERTDGIRAAVVVWSPGPAVRWSLPARSPEGVLRFDAIAPWAWPTWETPEWHTYLKPVYGALQRAWATP